MVIGPSPAQTWSTSERVRRTVALLSRRGFALGPERLGGLCLGGAVSESDVRWAVAATPELTLAHDLVVSRSDAMRAGAIRSRASAHESDAPLYLRMTAQFVRRLVGLAPFIRSVSIAGSLASGGFRASDDVDLNLIVDDGHRHIAYVAVNLLGLLHALGHRTKPVDDLTRRPLAPRLMTANLILERSQCHPLERQDEDMAFEMLMSQPVFGLDVFDGVVDANPELLDHFPQLGYGSRELAIDSDQRTRLPAWLFPAALDGAARRLGSAAWRYMQWTRRNKPEALARVAFVRATMRPYTLFDEADLT
ncbi:MAG: hypothetical protein AUG06_11995 [Actinobacteria bacterium 13_1_20CM_2_65_11]|nr:MAG: hypothetical protein AUH40_09540 [Chloroflexi bacterium 13_1_40CM_65_17]OLC65111.1 MAG: hypothetical protein AUH69_10295 [Actinobacteria bacterium 13_1_40CM_4_65_12]OLD27150.1 MAG: hypothetical protein AUJ02_00420 [Chloroflexi bacterium 13_1_40CM_3_65_12]OLD48788.1 MAG: hypothetical protein AUI42_10865 [Actinobacteria bacterium 13_1_40CM_2_65_8]OLE78034.1 MAG: hypothetical protein AUG06_11995 [Actinobacteria bacterium 13_1_20CM_2_65_11]